VPGSSGACLLPAIVQIFGENDVGLLVVSNQLATRRSLADRFLPVSRPDEAEFLPAAQTAFELLDWTFRGPRTVDRASCDALRPQSN
jgi:hypothetical protein